MAMLCAHPGCCAAAGKDFWACRDRTVIKTRAQLVAEGLLPETPMFGYAGPRLILLR